MPKTPMMLLPCLALACASATPPSPNHAVKAAERAPAVRVNERPASNPTADVAPTEPEDSDAHAIRELRRALALYSEFIERAGDDERYTAAVQRSRERIDDIRDTLVFLEQVRSERKPER